MSYNAIYFNNGFMRNGYIFSPIFGDLQKLKCVGDETTIILFGIECLISWMKDCIIFFSLQVYGSIPAFFQSLSVRRQNGTFCVAALPEIQSILFDAST